MAELHTDAFPELKSSAEAENQAQDGLQELPSIQPLKLRENKSQTCPISFPIKYRSEDTKLFSSKPLIHFIIILVWYPLTIPRKHFPLQIKIPMPDNKYLPLQF